VQVKCSNDDEDSDSNEDGDDYSIYSFFPELFVFSLSGELRYSSFQHGRPRLHKPLDKHFVEVISRKVVFRAKSKLVFYGKSIIYSL
jgi:hypothetical protein